MSLAPTTSQEVFFGLLLHLCIFNGSFSFFPSHVNICGNESTNSAVKSALSLPIMNMKLPACELIPQ